jgi:hypothetical protein
MKSVLKNKQWGLLKGWLKLVLSLHVCYWHAANAINASIMKLRKAIIAPA